MGNGAALRSSEQVRRRDNPPQPILMYSIPIKMPPMRRSGAIQAESDAFVEGKPKCEGIFIYNAGSNSLFPTHGHYQDHVGRNDFHR